jgi:hypothetical protein
MRTPPIRRKQKPEHGRFRDCRVPLSLFRGTSTDDWTSTPVLVISTEAPRADAGAASRSRADDLPAGAQRPPTAH